MNYEQLLEEKRQEIAKNHNDMGLRWEFLGVLKKGGLLPDYAAALEEVLHRSPERRPSRLFGASFESVDYKLLAQWSGFEDVSWDVHMGYNQGFVEKITIPYSYIAKVPPMLKRAPINRVVINGTPACATLPEDFSLLGALSICGDQIDDEFFSREILARQWPNLEYLGVSYTFVSRPNVERLAELTAKNFPKLARVDLGGRYDPTERILCDGFGFTSTGVPPAGEALEKRFGHIPWIHCGY